MDVRRRVIEIMEMCDGDFLGLTDPMEELDEAGFTVENYIKTVELFKGIYPDLCDEIIEHLEFLLGTLDDDLPTLQKISLFLNEIK